MAHDLPGPVRLRRRPLLRHRRTAFALGALAVVLAVVALVLGDAVPSRRPAAASPQPAALGTLGVPGWTTVAHEISVGGLRRGYLVARPVAPGTGPLPVVVLLHGRGMTAAAMARRTGMLGGRRAVLVIPAGYGRSWNAGACCGSARARGVDDVTFLSRVVQQAVTQTPGADPAEVYLAGFSNGGRMAYRMACQRPSMFAAVAAVEAVPMYSCPSLARPVPLLVVASSRDPLLRITSAAPVKVIDGVRQPSVASSVSTWRSLEGCPPAGRADGAGTLASTTWTCRDGAVVRYDLYSGGTHTWPPGSARTPGASSEFWSFVASTGRARAA